MSLLITFTCEDFGLPFGIERVKARGRQKESARSVRIMFRVGVEVIVISYGMRKRAASFQSRLTLGVIKQLTRVPLKIQCKTFTHERRKSWSG